VKKVSETVNERKKYYGENLLNVLAYVIVEYVSSSTIKHDSSFLKADKDHELYNLKA
jgi:hypothetical protein